MNNKPSPTPEHWATSVFSDYATKGKTNAFIGFFQLFIKVNTAIVSAFLHRKTGVHFITGGTIFWGTTLLFLIVFICGLTGSLTSIALFWWLMIAFFCVGTYRRIEAHINLRRGKNPRYSGDVGYSSLWHFPLKWIFRKLRLAHREGYHSKWWYIDEWRFQRFIEPSLVLLTGYLFKQYEYGAFGNYIMLCGACYFTYMNMLANNYYKVVQAQIDGEVVSQTIQGEKSQQTLAAPSGNRKVIQTKSLRSDKDFEEWQKERAAIPSASSPEVVTVFK